MNISHLISALHDVRNEVMRKAPLNQRPMVVKVEIDGDLRDVASVRWPDVDHDNYILIMTEREKQEPEKLAVQWPQPEPGSSVPCVVREWDSITKSYVDVVYGHHDWRLSPEEWYCTRCRHLEERRVEP